MRVHQARMQALAPRWSPLALAGGCWGLVPGSGRWVPGIVPGILVAGRFNA